MGVPGRINVGTQVLEPIVEHFLRVDKAEICSRHLSNPGNKPGRTADYPKCCGKNNQNSMTATDFNAEAAKMEPPEGQETKTARYSLLFSVEVNQRY